ncbi:hypothetical protein BKA93DRAFT_734214 [Sparassis latifolia]
MPEPASKFLATANHHGVPQHELHLKVDAVCSLLRNVSVEKGLVKNICVVVHALHRCFIEIKLLKSSSQSEPEIICLSHTTFTFNPSHSSWMINHCQFPLHLAYATTFNECQGLTLNCTILDLCTDIFTHGQLYTVLSQVHNRNSSHILFHSSNTSHMTANVVYKELLL